MTTLDLSVQEDVSLGLIVFIICLSVPLIIVIIVGNAIVIISIYRKSSSVRSPNEIFILALALVDFLTGLVGIPFAVVGFLIRKQFLYTVNCAIWYFVPIVTCATASNVNLIVISLDRFLAIKYPLRYRVWMSPGRAIRICVFADLFGIISGSISYTVTAFAAVFVSSPNVTYEYDCGQYPLYDIYGSLANNYFTRPLISLSIPFLFILYAYIFTIASKKTKEAARRRGETVSTREMKITKTSAVVLLVYTLCVSPNIIKSAIQTRIYNGSTWLVWYPWFTDFIVISNSMINPFIYAGRSKMMRKDFEETINFLISKACPLLYKTKNNDSNSSIGLTSSTTRKPLASINKSSSEG